MEGLIREEMSGFLGGRREGKRGIRVCWGSARRRAENRAYGFNRPAAVCSPAAAVRNSGPRESREHRTNHYAEN
jgi:hypothetical protein